MSRRVYLLGVGLALVALGLAFAHWLLPPTVTPALVKRVRPGMTVREVEALFGRPAGPLRFNVLQWDGPDGAALVFLDPDSRVCAAEFVRWGLGDDDVAPQSPPGLFARLRAWLGW